MTRRLCVRVCVYTRDTHESARICSFRSLPSADSNYSKGQGAEEEGRGKEGDGEPCPRRDSSRKELNGLALLTPFLKPVSRVNNTKRMCALPARVRKTVTRIYYNIVYPPPTGGTIYTSKIGRQMRDT